MKNILKKDKIDEIHAWCDEVSIWNYSINTDGSIDVDGDVELRKLNLDFIPYKFNIVHGNFSVEFNSLKDLHNSPNIVHGNFLANNNSLTSLEGFPKKVDKFVHLNENYRLNNLYVGDYDVVILESIYLFECGFDSSLTAGFTNDVDPDDEIYDEDILHGMSTIRTIFRYQRHFEIWNKDLSLNVANYQELLDEIKDGLQ